MNQNVLRSMIMNSQKVKIQNLKRCHKRWYYHVFTTLLEKSLVLLTWKRIECEVSSCLIKLKNKLKKIKNSLFGKNTIFH